MKKFIIFCVVTCGLMIADHAIAGEKVTTAPKKAVKPVVKVVKSAKPVAKVVPAAKPVVKVVKSVKPPVVEVKPVEKESDPALCFARGLSNVTLCWLEIPRCMIYDNKVIPVFGLIVGIPEGAIYTVGRALSGVVDIISFGFVGDALYSKRFPSFIWDAKWKPAEK